MCQILYWTMRIHTELTLLGTNPSLHNACMLLQGRQKIKKVNRNPMVNEIMLSAKEKKVWLTQSKERNEAECLSTFFCTGPGPSTVYVPE